jgi:tRNA A37 threonylcarbamoyladenosine dehydratase
MDGRGKPDGLLTLRRDDDAEGYKLHRRFDRMGRLVGDEGMQRLFSSHALVFGMGGVGSWTAEALARAGVGRLTLIDFDLVCVTNGNRQLHAMKGTTGKPKVEVMAERLRKIHPGCEIEAVRRFYDADTSTDLLGPVESDRATVIVDAIDNLTAKTHLIARCREQGRSLVVSGGASGRMDPTQISEADLAQVRGDSFLAYTRKILRKDFDFPEKAPWGIPTIWSKEPAAQPRELSYDEGEGFRCVCPQGQNDQHSCERRSVIYGTAGFVTGSFGLACAATATRLLLEH